MRKEDFIFKDDEGVEIFVYKWLPGDETKVKGVVQISHGMAETAARYERFAGSLTKAGFVVYANDHRGHGRTAKTVENVGYMGEDGFNWAVKDMKQLNGIIKKENPGKPIFLLGHSMGSFLAQRYITLYGDSINGVILSGTTGRQGLVLNLGIRMAANEVKKVGAKTSSKKLNDMSFGSYNNAFKPARTDFDWLSRDTKEVDKYINDSFCGAVFTAGFFFDLAKGMKEMHKKENMRNIPKNLPIYLFSGDMDPVGKDCKTLYPLIKTYEKLRIKDVTYKFYKGGRHEMLNEINKDEVTNDTIDWLNRHCE